MRDSAIEDLAGQIASDEADLKAATEIRATEEAAFSAEEKDLVETIDTDPEGCHRDSDSRMLKGRPTVTTLKRRWM